MEWLPCPRLIKKQEHPKQCHTTIYKQIILDLSYMVIDCIERVRDILQKGSNLSRFKSSGVNTTNSLAKGQLALVHKVRDGAGDVVVQVAVVVQVNYVPDAVPADCGE